MNTPLRLNICRLSPYKLRQRTPYNKHRASHFLSPNLVQQLLTLQEQSVQERGDRVVKSPDMRYYPA